MSAMKNISHFFKKDLWRKDKNNFFHKFLRVLLSSARGFMTDRGFDKASTLTFYTLLAIIPLAAISFGIAQALGFAEKFSEQINAWFASQPQVAEKLIEFSYSTLKTTRGGIIASFGLVVLFWTVIKTIGNIESFLNEIWEVTTPRTLWQQIKRYTPVVLLFPIFVVGASSVLIFMSSTALATSQAIHLSLLSPLIKSLFHLASYLVSWSLLSFLYIYLPNTKVPWKAGILAGIITGLLFLVWQWVYITFQAQAASYGIIYGSFAAVPLFLIWLNYSWLIVIFGAELCYHIHQESKRARLN